ncbi:fungal hydrophobin domain-containing protein [Sarocladium implicatum]|nr:fungal hydrophobin domain-containing protein [Sarocladium implicatum]
MAMPTGGGGGGDGGGCEPGGGGDGGGDGGDYEPCTSTLYSNPQCCATDVLGVIGLNCANPSEAPASKDAFVADCATVGQQALCCVLPVANQDVLCQPPV